MTSSVIRKLLQKFYDKRMKDMIARSSSPKWKQHMGEDVVGSIMAGQGIGTLFDLLMKSQGMQQGGYWDNGDYWTIGFKT